MRLTKAIIRNFRSIRNVTIDFEPSCRILVGINESGKSNILKALALLDPDRAVVPEDLREFGDKEKPNQDAMVRFVLHFEPHERTAAFEHLQEHCQGITSATQATVGSEALTFRELFAKQTDMVYDVDLKTGKRAFKFYGWPEGWQANEKLLKPIVNSAGITTRIDGEDVQLQTLELLVERNAVTTSFLEPANIGYLRQIVNRAFKSLFADELPECMYWEYSDENLLPAKIQLNAFAAKPTSCVPLLRMFELAGYENSEAVSAAIADAQKLPSNGIRNLFKRVAATATNHMRRVWKDYKNIKIQLQPNGEYIDASIQDKFNAYDFSRRSDGFKRFVTFLLLVSASA